MARLLMTTRIDEPPDVVFGAFSDFANAPKRISGIKKLELLTDGPIGVGTRFRETRVMFNKEATEVMEITAFEPGKSYTVGCRSCGCEYQWTFRFKPNGRGTTVEFEMNARAISLFAKIVSPLTSLMMGPMMKKCMEKDMNDLKAAIEKPHNS